MRSEVTSSIRLPRGRGRRSRFSSLRGRGNDSPGWVGSPLDAGAGVKQRPDDSPESRGSDGGTSLRRRGGPHTGRHRSTPPGRASDGGTGATPGGAPGPGRVPDSPSEDGATCTTAEDTAASDEARRRDFPPRHRAPPVMAVALGFEPRVAMNHTDFRDLHLRPLGHATSGVEGTRRRARRPILDDCEVAHEGRSGAVADSASSPPSVGAAARVRSCGSARRPRPRPGR